MFRKLLLSFFFFLLLIILVACEESPKEMKQIPEEAIRLRILAHSDDPIDQAIKLIVRDAVNEEVVKWAIKAKDIEEARTIIRGKLPEINAVIKQVLVESGVDYSHEAIYSKQVDFPDKQYNDAFYPAGDYEAILITLGAGAGENWWCVLFPPLCFIDLTVDSDEREAAPADEVKVKSLLFKWLKIL